MVHVTRMQAAPRHCPRCAPTTSSSSIATASHRSFGVGPAAALVRIRLADQRNRALRVTRALYFQSPISQWIWADHINSEREPLTLWGLINRVILIDRTPSAVALRSCPSDREHPRSPQDPTVVWKSQANHSSSGGVIVIWIFPQFFFSSILFFLSIAGRH